MILSSLILKKNLEIQQKFILEQKDLTHVYGESVQLKSFTLYMIDLAQKSI